ASGKRSPVCALAIPGHHTRRRKKRTGLGAHLRDRKMRKIQEMSKNRRGYVRRSGLRSTRADPKMSIERKEEQARRYGVLGTAYGNARRVGVFLPTQRLKNSPERLV